MKIVVSGASGFLGRNLVKILGEKYRFVSLDRHELFDESAVRSKFQGADVFIHLAGISTIADCEKDIATAFQVNVGLSGYLTEMYYRINPKGKVVFASTGQVYDVQSPAPFAEHSQVAAGNLYARTKLAAEGVVTAVAQSTGGCLVVLRLFNISHKSQSDNFFVPSIYKQLLTTPAGTVEVQVGNVDIFRDFSSIQEVVAKIDQIILRKSTQHIELFNICSGIPVFLRSIIEDMAKHIGKHVQIFVVADRVRPDEVKVQYGRSALSVIDEPTLSHDERVSKFVNHFLQDI